MNPIDLVVYLVLALAVFEGWRRGVVLQICSLAGLFAGIWLAARYGSVVGRWLRMDDAVAVAGGFTVVLIAAILAVAIAGKLLRKLFRFVGFGIPDIVLGIAVSVLKYLLLLSVLFAALGNLEDDNGLVTRETIDGSRWYGPVRKVSDHIFPFLDWVGDQIPSGE